VNYSEFHSDLLVNSAFVAVFSAFRAARTKIKRISTPHREGQFCKIKHHRARTPTTLYPHANMSRFFHGDSSSESSSSDEEELYSEEEPVAKVASDEDEDEEEEDDEEEDSSSEDEDGAKKSGANRFMRDAESESEESSDEDRAKIVKSAKDKRLEELEATVKAIENGQKINDWGVISTGMSFWANNGPSVANIKARIRQAQPPGCQTCPVWQHSQAIYQGHCRTGGFHE
jgi:Eukaryotic translation initiation factor 3 subunit 8 N-terminus